MMYYLLFYGKYMIIFNLLNLSSLADDRRRSHNLAFLNKFLSGSVDCSPLLALINFKVPVKCTRNTHTTFFYSTLPYKLFKKRAHQP